ncbi:CBU_0592 family membrane protein [Leucobacter sp. M11]|uniref:CBU_0592 family membrane protein n=1 Tax=Leucobacter sp. M11 TaxID=2993565 RepID=UPI002D7F26C6|nr:hypothetical protein [Leucobacter sp. M11]MEB4613549.1 hypothetical protein [Leucobacter sp. M11]
MDDIYGSILGWLGTAGTLSAYVLIWRGWVSPTGKRYAALNTIGGILAGAGAFAFGAWPAVASNVVWAVIGIHGLITATQRDRRESGSWQPSIEDQTDFDPVLTEEPSVTLLETQPLRLVQTQSIQLPTPEQVREHAAQREASQDAYVRSA